MSSSDKLPKTIADPLDVLMADGLTEVLKKKIRLDMSFPKVFLLFSRALEVNNMEIAMFVYRDTKARGGAATLFVIRAMDRMLQEKKS